MQNQNQKTKKMVSTQQELDNLRSERNEVVKILDTLYAHRPTTEEGKTALTQSIEKRDTERHDLSKRIAAVEARLEVETIAMLAGEDTEMAEPSPADALRSAS